MSERRRVIYDLDGTLVHGDIGHAFIKHLLMDSWPRKLIAGLATPVLMPAMKITRFRRSAISAYLWLGTVGRAGQIPAMAEAFAQRYPLQILPTASARLRADLAETNEVVIATGALEQLSRVLIARMQLPRAPMLVASTIRPAFGGYVVGRQCNSHHKIQALAEAGFATFDCAYTDAMLDWPLLAQAREPILVSDHAPTIAAMRSRIGEHLQVIAP